MKKLMILCCLMFVVSAAVFAQEEEQSSKKATIKELPEGWLPQAGDWAISIDATPLLQYIGNVASAKTNNTLDDFGATPYSYFTDNCQNIELKYNPRLDYIKIINIKSIFLLTTKTADWFENLGFKSDSIDTLPQKRKEILDKKRGSKVLRLILN